MRTNKFAIFSLIALVVVLVSAFCYQAGIFKKPEFAIYDAQAELLRAGKAPDSRIKVILVDEASLKSMSDVAGRWPWPRAIWSDLLDYLALGGARAVLFDILFLEKQDERNDRALHDATQASGNVYHSMLVQHETADPGMNISAQVARSMPADFINRYALKTITGAPAIKAGTRNNDYELPIAGLAGVSRGMGVVEFAPDSDGSLRRTRPLREYGGRYFPVLGIAPFVNDRTPVVFKDGAIVMGDRTLPVDHDGNCLINMYGLDRVDAYSISGIFESLQKIRKGDVENLLVNPDEFRDSIVFVGASAVGTSDLKAIPVSPSAPGVMLHAFLASNYLQQDFMHPPARHLTWLSMFIGAFLTAWSVMYFRRLVVRAIFPLSLIALYVVYAVYSFSMNMQVEIVPFIFATFSTGFLSFGYLTFTEGFEKRRVSQLFAQYVSKDVLEEVLNHYQEYLKTNAGQKVEITVLFSDIRNFTTISETEPPERIVEMLNVHFGVMADIILRHNGTIDKYIGDAIMAFWGAPVKTEDHAEQAVRAAQEMLAGMAEVNRILTERGFGHEVRIGIGINTGPATIGNIGSEQKKNYTVVGDTVNLSSRLEGVTKEYATPLLFSEFTYERIKSKMNCRYIANVKVKGREKPVDIYTAD